VTVREGSGVRVVSLVPSATETLRAWDVDPVACTSFCEQVDLPTVGGTKNPDVAAVVDLGPDLVVLDEEENRREDHDALVAAGVPVHVLSIRSVADLDAQLPTLADRVGARWEPIGDGPSTSGPRRRVVVPIWRRPWMVLGPDTYGASLLELLGFDVVPSDLGRYPTVDLEQLGDLSADVVLVPSEPYAFTDAHLEDLAGLGPAIRVDGQDLLWWGARTRGALDRLAAHLASATG
jgi:ABC-type Fe3+-hydroxamate transport system substrate-binding protein